MMKDKKLVILTAGGTGGHIYPAEALATELEHRGFNVMLFTDARGLNNYKGKLGKIENRAICSGSVIGKSVLTKIISLFKVGLGVLQAGFYLFRVKPCCVVGFGGYASFPTAVASIILRIPLIVHEQNSVMSRTNRILAPFASVVAQSFRKVKNTPKGSKSVLTGMPVRETIALLHEQPRKKSSDKKTLVILGGSQGARVFAEVVPAAVKLLDGKLQEKLTLYQQCRKGEEAQVEQAYEGLPCKTIVRSFFENMPELYSQADFMISRSGASSVYEIAAAGVPAMFVPLPIAADNHQYYNAEEFVEAGAACLVLQKDFTPEKVKHVLEDLFSNPEHFAVMSEKAKDMALVDASAQLADVVQHFVC